MDAASWANLIAGTAFVVAVVSAVIAWKAASEAKLANRISIHEYQRRLYEGFLEAYELVQMYGLNTDLEKFARLTVHIKTAPLYVDDSISRELQQFYDAFIEVYDAESKLKRAYSDSADASKRSLVGGNIGKFAKAESEKANIFAENCQAEADAAVKRLLKIGSDLDKVFVDKIKLG